MFPTPRIATEKIPECKPHIERGDHKRLYRFSPDEYRELSAVFNGPHPETAMSSRSSTGRRKERRRTTYRPQPKAFVPDFHPEEIAEIATRLRADAGLPKEPSGEGNVAPDG